MGMLENIAHRRLNADPVRRAEVLHDIDSFKDSLRNTGTQTKKTALTIIGKGILKPFAATFKASLGMKGSSMGKAFGESVKGSGASALDIVRLVFHAAETTGRFTKVAARLALKK